MTIRCSELDNLLFEGDASSLALAAGHARTCDACMETFTIWSQLSDTAKSMQTTWDSDLLWPRIERGLRQQRRGRWMTLLQVAAVLLLISGMAVVAWRFRQRSKFDEFILQTSAIEEVDRAQEAHLAAIQKLEREAGPKLDTSASPLLVSYKEKLMLLDDAIAECQSNIDHNRQNAQLRRQLLAIYGEKQQTLQNVLREELHATP